MGQGGGADSGRDLGATNSQSVAVIIPLAPLR